MAMTGRKKAFFVVFTYVDLRYMEVDFDGPFWESMVRKLSAFYANHYRKHIASNM